MKQNLTSILIIGLAMTAGNQAAIAGSDATRSNAHPTATVATMHGSVAAGDAYSAQIRAGFTNMLSHQPYRGPTQTRMQFPAPDAVVRTMNIALGRNAGDDGYWSQVIASFDTMLDHGWNRAGEDVIAASFVRDLNRESTATHPISRISAEQDPLPEVFRLALQGAAQPQAVRYAFAQSD